MPRSAYSHEFVSLCPPSPNVTFYNVTNFTRQNLTNHVWMDGASETVGCIHPKSDQIGGDLLLSTEKLAEKVRILGYKILR